MGGWGLLWADMELLRAQEDMGSLGVDPEPQGFGVLASVCCLSGSLAHFVPCIPVYMAA